MSRILYTSVSGRQITAHSHSGGQDFKCPRKYFYKRVQGWQAREDRPSLEFGKCVEAAVKYHYAKNFEPGSGVEEFKTLWFKQQDNSELVFTEKTGDWSDHYRMGSELLALFELQRPELLLHNVVFQKTFKRELFPETEYSGLEFTAIVDMLADIENSHPALPASTDGSVTRPIVIDIKTSSTSYYVDPRFSALDDQLRDYSWSTKIPTVAFLVLVKNFSGLLPGDWITVLRGAKAGKKYQVFDTEGPNILCLTKQDYDDYTVRKKEIKGKGSKEAQEALLTEYFYKGFGFSRGDVTKQKIQFLPAVISEEDMLEAFSVACAEAIEISECSSKNYFPKMPGVRFPHNHCLSCEMLPLCLDDKDMIREKLIQIGGDF